MLGALGVGLTIAQMVALRDGLSGLPYVVRFEQWRLLMGCFGLVLLLPLLILWRIWMYQTTAFASNLGVPPTSHSPAWAAWCGLIPFAGPWLEVQVLREVWQVSINPGSWRAQAIPNATLNQLSSAGTAVWILLALMLAIGMASALPRESIAPILRGLERHLYDPSLLMELDLRIQLLLDLGGLAQASYALRVLNGINARQTALALRLDAR